MSSRTQIIATIGPSCREVPIIARMIAAGMDVARINFSHGTLESSGEYISGVREAVKITGKRVPLIQDLAGPRTKTDAGHEFNVGEKSAVTEKDLSDLDFGIGAGVDYIAQSYVGSAEDVRLLKRAVEKRGAKIPIIAKIERAEAVKNFNEILAEADAIMVARGDLGYSVPIEEIPFIESDITTKCRTARKPVIVATEMLFSMVENKNPTRAEVTDIAYAILIGSDAVMLSDETARGKYPVEAVTIMERIVARYERAAKTGGTIAL